MMVEKHPPPNFLAPQAAIIPLKKSFILAVLSLTDFLLDSLQLNYEISP